MKRYEKINTHTIWEDLVSELCRKKKSIAAKNMKIIRNNNNIRYFDGRVEILDAHSVKVTRSSGLSHILTAKQLIISTGTKLEKENIPGSDLGITAEQLFQLAKPPGKTLITGDTLKSLELAGILGKMGIYCIVITNGTCKVFDKDLLHQVIQIEKVSGVRFLLDYKVNQLARDVENILVTGVSSTGQEYIEHFNTVVFATNRRGRTSNLGLVNVGLKVNKTNDKIIARADGITANPSVFVTGSVLDGPLSCSDNATSKY